MRARRYSRLATILLAGEALAALAHARLILHRTSPKDVLARNRAARNDVPYRAPDPDDDRLRDGCDRIAFVVPRLGARLPWRTDCLVQALAGQKMLRRRGIAGEIVVGATRHGDGNFEAHAWLTCAGRVVLGGDVSRFGPLLPSGHDSLSIPRKHAPDA